MDVNISTNLCLIFLIWCNPELILYSQSSPILKYIFEIYSKANVLQELTNKAKYRRDCTEEKVLG